MLVLTRKHNERIDIGPDIRVTVVRCSRGQVRLGIDAPPGVRILRAELADPPPRTPEALEDAGEHP